MERDKGAPREVPDESVTSEEEGDPKNVGKSVTRRGEDVAKQEPEKGRSNVGRKGASDRPAGKRTARDRTGVDPKDQIDPRSPYL